jgi:hypothetical protein
MPRLAILTIGVLHEAWDHPRLEGFRQRTPPTFAAARASPGFVALADDADPGHDQAWGAHTAPVHFQRAEYADRLPDTLSLWRDLESLFAFAYHGTHGEALGHRRDWFMGGLGPAHVAWWVADDHTPTWQEASDRYDQLQRGGPSPAAFELKQPFDHAGRPTKVDRAAVKALTAPAPPP